MTAVARESLTSGRTTSCGCGSGADVRSYGYGRTRHGLRNTRIYKIWERMLARCKNKNDQNFPNYGGRGIDVCERWMSVDNFFKDMGFPPDGLTLERKDTNESYCPENCIWETPKAQANNKRNNHLLSFEGRTMTMAQWAETVGLSYSALGSRIYDGWSTERALLTPLQGKPLTPQQCQLLTALALT